MVLHHGMASETVKLKASTWGEKNAKQVGGRASDTMMKRLLLDNTLHNIVARSRASFYGKFCLACRLKIATVPWNDENDVLLIIPNTQIREIFISKIATFGIFQIADINFIMKVEAQGERGAERKS